MTTLRTVPTMQAWVDDHLERRKAQGASPRTIHNYRHVLRRFAHWVDGCTPTCSCELRRIGFDPRDLTPEHIDDWWHSPDGLNVLGRGLSPSAWVQYRSTLRGFFSKYLIRWRLVRNSDGLMDAIDSVTVKRDKKHWLTAGQLNQIVDSADHPWIRIILALMVHQVPRQSEVRALKYGDVNLDAGTIRWWNEKADTPLLLEISPRLDKELRCWFCWYAEHYGPLTPDMFVVPQRWKNGHCTGDGAYLFKPHTAVGDLHPVVGRYVQPFMPPGVKYDGKCHCLRRSAASVLLDYLISLERIDALDIVSAMLGHTGPNALVTTMRYLNVDVRQYRARAALRGVEWMPDPGGAISLAGAREVRAG